MDRVFSFLLTTRHVIMVYALSVVLDCSCDYHRTDDVYISLPMFLTTVMLFRRITDVSHDYLFIYWSTCIRPRQDKHGCEVRVSMDEERMSR